MTKPMDTHQPTEAMNDSASDLLEALETIIYGHLLDPRDSGFEEASDMAQRAINKARGKESIDMKPAGTRS